MRTRTAILAATALFAAASCETYEQVPENSNFTIAASVADGPRAVAVITVTEGSHEGDCLLDVSLKEADGGTPAFSILLNGTTQVDSGKGWRFDGDGRVSFTLDDLPGGTYTASFTVRRWYHSATASGVTFTIND